MFVSAIIAAAGRGLRLGSAQPKQLLSVGGQTVLERSVALFLAHPTIGEVIVALPADLVEAPPDYLRGASKPLRVVAGGGRRQDSVANALRIVSDRTDLVVIHDAARPFASADLIARTIHAAAESGAAVAALPARDTVKIGDRRDWAAGALVRETLARESVYLVQTPQAFRREILRDALAGDGDATDESTLVERAGHPVRLVEGEPDNIKITTPEDLRLAEAIAGGRRLAAGSAASGAGPGGVGGAPSVRTGRAGIGYDLHRLVPGRRLVLGGVEIPSDWGALGHSDADVVCHALTDAILGAAGLGDIGGHFPDSDPAWKDASGLDLLGRVVAQAAEHGLEIGNVDVTVVLERPKIRDHVDSMRARIAATLGIAASRVSVKGKTNEGLDAVGRGEAIAAHAIALVRARA